MEDSAAVLFIVTIPTEIEENRLKAEFIAKKLDVRSDQIDLTTISTTTAAAAANNEEPAQNDVADVEVDDDENEQSTNIETASATQVELSSTENSKKLTPNFNTLPKSRRRRRQSANDIKSEGGGGNKLQNLKQSATDSGSFKDSKSDAATTPLLSQKSFESLRDALTASGKRKPNEESVILRKEASSSNSSNIDLTTPNDTCMERVVREILKKFQISNAVWTKDSQGHKHQIIFTIEFNEICEKILDKFYEWGIGDREGSSVSVMNCIVAKTSNQEDDAAQKDDLKPKEDDSVQQKRTAWERFMNSVQCRLNVAQTVRDVRQNASITFDFLILLISAAILAACGLVEDSVVFLAASMLISPLMGPIIAGVFGTVIKDPSLRLLGLKNELFGILVAILVGFVFGLVVCNVDERYSVGEGLTTEMLSRCEIHSLLVGIFTAIPSGAAGAIGVLGGNVGSLVGVAISASLLPPAVNSGLLWALACIYKYYETDETRYPNVVKTHYYSENQATELAVMGAISMCLTISNIICVFIVGIFVLKVKEIAPAISRTNREFWKRDIKLARVLSRTQAECDADAAIMDEFANLPKEDQRALGINSEILRRMKDVDNSGYQNTWSPIGNQRDVYETIYEPRFDNYTTVHRLERLYSTITNQREVENRPRFSISQRSGPRRSDFGGVSYRILAEKYPRYATMPEETASQLNLNFDGRADQQSTTTPTTTRTPLTDERRGRKFIVTPANEDSLPLRRGSSDSKV